MSSLLNPTSPKKKIESNESTQDFTSRDVKFSFTTTTCVAPWDHSKQSVVLFHPRKLEKEATRRRIAY
jgi:hypothetical protein